MTITEAQHAMLIAPLESHRVATRDAGRGHRVPYLEGWDLIGCANAIFGFDGWSYDVLSTEAIRSWTITRRDAEVMVTLYQARVRVEALGAVRIDVGTSVTSEDSAEAHDTAIKGAATDGLKRALRTFGAQFGNDLYDKGGPPAQNAGAAQPPTHEQGPRAMQPRAESVTPAGEGDFYAWAWREPKMVRTDVLKVTGVREALDAGDFEAAKRLVLAAKVVPA